MKTLNPNFVCTCGHKNKDHNGAYDAQEGWWENACDFTQVAWDNPNRCSCADFKPDNLKTLELMQKQA